MKVLNDANRIMDITEEDFVRLTGLGLHLTILKENGSCPYCESRKASAAHIKKCFKKAPLISIVIPSRAEESIECMDSIEAQTWKKYETIIEYDKKREGANIVRNKGLKKSKGKYIFYCDNDVQLAENCLEVLYKQLIKDNADLCHGKIKVDDYVTPLKDGVVPKDKHSEEYIQHFYQVSTMTLIRRSINPEFDPNIRRFDDWDLWVMLDKKGYKATWVDSVILTTKNRANGLSMEDNYIESLEILYKKHEIKKKRKIADIIIPHHDRHDLLKDCLDGIDNQLFNIIIVSGGTFAENCNKGAKIAETSTLIFLNDDTLPENDKLVKLAESKYDICGTSQTIDGKKIYGMGWKRARLPVALLFYLASNPKEVVNPSGYCFKVKKDVWNKLGGFNENYRNGAEDNDLFLRAMQEKISIGYIDEPMVHHHSQSKGRYYYDLKNKEYFNKHWTINKVESILNL